MPCFYFLSPQKIVMILYCLRFAILTISIVALNACTKDNLQPELPPSNKKITEAFAAGAATKVELYAQQDLFTGYNNLYIALTDSTSGQAITNAQLSILPMMNMGMMNHSSPAEQPVPGAGTMFNAAIVFTMPSTMGTWTIEVTVTRNGKTATAILPVTVTDPRQVRVKSFVSKADGKKFFVALLQPAAPKVGINELELAVYQSKNSMEYQADSSLSFIADPQMPTMHHGSPNNVNPVHTANGHYKGKVNFTMTGLWHVNLDSYAGAAVADSALFFEVNF
jgi:hypothetical protein